MKDFILGIVFLAMFIGGFFIIEHYNSLSLMAQYAGLLLSGFGLIGIAGTKILRTLSCALKGVKVENV